MCDTFRENKIVNIPENANILEYINNLMQCINTNGYFEYYDTTTNRKEHRIINKLKIERTNNDRNNFEPCIITSAGSVRPYPSKYANGVSACALCQNLNIVGFDTTTVRPDIMAQFANRSPNLNKLFLLYKDMIIYDNNDPYMEGHLMLLSLNHINSKVIGSQYEILNINTLTKVLELYRSCASGISMGHNYALTGSQVHFHIHIFLKQFLPYIPYDDMIDFYANTLYGRVINNISNTEILTDATGIQHNLEFTMNDENGGKIIIAKYDCPTYGYKGILVTTKNTPFNFRKYCATVHKILNDIENSGSHTFSLYLCRSNTNLNLCILPQNINNVLSFRQLSAFSEFRPAGVAESFRELKQKINNYVKLDVLSIEELNKLINTNIYNEMNPLGDNQLSMHFNLSRANTYNKYTVSLFKDKKSVNVPQVVFFHGPAGIGKSSSKKDIDGILTDMNLDPTNFIYLTIDELFETIPGVIKEIKVVKDILKTIKDKQIRDITPLVNDAIKDKKLSELKNDDLFDSVSKEDFIELYKNIFDKVYPETNGKTLYNFYKQNIKDKYNDYKNKLEVAILEYIRDNKLNVIVEVVTLDNNAKNKYTTHLGITQDNTIYINKKFNLDTDNTLNTSDLQYKFLFRNILFRNIECGRLLNIKDINGLLDNFFTTHSDIMSISNAYNALASKHITLYTGYQLNKDDLSYIDSFVKNINYISFPYLSGDIIDKPDIKDIIKNLHCFNKRDGDIDIVTETVDDTITHISYGLSCFAVPGTLNLDEKFDLYDEIKGKLTDFNTDYLFNDNITSIIMHLFVYSMNKSIAEYIKNFKNLLNNRTIPDGIKNIKLKQNDIKLILKGGLSIRSLCNQFISHIEQTIENNIKTDSVDNKNINETLNILKSTFDNNIDTPFKGIFKKSDIDFTMYLNKRGMTREQYDFIINDLQKITISVLTYIRYIIKSNNFFDREQYLEEKMENIFKDGIKHPVSNYDLTHIKYNKTVHKVPGKADINLPWSVKKSFYVDAKNKLSGDPAQQESLLLIPSNMFLFDSRLNNPIIRPDFFDNYESSYYISINNNIKIIKGMIETFSLIRLKNCYMCGFENDTDGTKYSGELIDVGFLSYESGEHHHIQENPNYVLQVKQSHNLFNYDINVFSLEFQLKEIEKMLIDTTIYIWENAKYKKRIKRYFFIDILEKFTSTENIMEYFEVQNEYKNIFDLLQGNLTTDGIVKIDGEDYIQFKDSAGKIIGKTNNKFILYLHGDKITEAQNFIDDRVDITNFVNDKRVNFNINLDLSTPDKINLFKQYLTTSKINYIRDLIEIMRDIIKLSESLFNIYLFYPNKYEEIKKLRDEEKIIKQWGGYKKLYLDMKEKYYKLKFNK